MKARIYTRVLSCVKEIMQKFLSIRGSFEIFVKIFIHMDEVTQRTELSNEDGRSVTAGMNVFRII